MRISIQRPYLFLFVSLIPDLSSRAFLFFSAEQIQIIAVLPTIIGLIADFIVSLLFLAFYSILVFFLKKEKITQWIFVIILLIKSFFSYVNYRYALVNNDLIPFDFFWFYGKDIIADQTYLKGLVEDLLKQDVIFVVLIPLMFSIMFRQRIFFSINAPFKTKIFKQKSFFGRNPLAWIALPGILFFVLVVTFQISNYHFVLNWIVPSWNIEDKFFISTSKSNSTSFQLSAVFEQPEKPFRNIDSSQKPNILFITMESFRANENSAYGGKQGITPYFEKLAKKGVLFTRIFHNGCCSHSGMLAIQCAQQPQVHLLIKKKPKLNVICLGDILYKDGYNTYALEPHSPKASSSFSLFHSLHGFQKIINKDNFPSNAERLGWSLSDRETLKMADTILQHIEEPFLLNILLQTNHTPYVVPKAYYQRYTDNSRQDHFLNTLKYSDEMMGKFLLKFLNTPIGKKTIVVVTADHSIKGLRSSIYQRTFGEQDKPWFFEIAYSQIPLLIIFPEKYQLNGGTVNTLGSQIDMLPTLLDVLGLKYEDKTYGYSLFQERNIERFVYITEGSSEQIITKNLFMYLKPQQNKAVMDWYGNPVEQISPDIRYQKEMISRLKKYNNWSFSCR